MPGFLEPREVQAVNDAVDHAWTDRSVYNPLTIAAYTGTPGYIETFLRNVDPSARRQSYKLNHLYLYDQKVRDLLLGNAVQGLVATLLEGTPLLFNSLSMERGTEQRFHFDTFYMPPPEPDRMVVLWFALEDVAAGAGALQYYPRSHRIPPYRFSHGELWAPPHEMGDFDRYIEEQIRTRGLEPRRFFPKAGDVFVWHAQLYHGGAPIEDPGLTRRSLVAHFWRVEDAFDQAWEVAPGRYIMDPRHMCVSPDFQAI